MSWSQDVFSKMVSRVAYDEESQTLTITWAKNGRISAYTGVPEDVALACANAPSVGIFVNSEIKPNYEHTYVG